MAVQLKDGGRYPASRKLSKAEFERFVAACENPAEPSQALKDRLANVGKRKA